jgi:hypothetical protein
MKKNIRKSAKTPISGPIRRELLKVDSLRSVALATGLTYSVVHGFAHGGNPSADTLDALAVHFGLVAKHEEPSGSTR